MKRSHWMSALVLSAALVAVALVQSCSSATDSDDDGNGGGATAIDEAAVGRGIEEMGAFIPVCRQGSGNVSAAIAAGDGPPPSIIGELLAIRRDPAARAAYAIAQGLGPTKPADQLGDCGGRITYPQYSHSNGVTTGTYAYQNYCSIDDDTGERTTQDGIISFVNTGTPSQSGPITNRIDADSPDGITVVRRTSGGTQISSSRYTFTDYVYTAGVPGGNPTAANPNRFTAEEVKIVNQVTSKTYRQEDYSATYFLTPSGGEQATMSGRGFRSNGEYFDLTTTSPMTSNSSGDITGGVFTFTGANNSKAVLTLVPGSELQGTMTVNGTPLTAGLPVCR